MRKPDDRARFDAAIAAIDAANADDPNTLVVGATSGPKELVHARMMTGWLEVLDPDADELQHLAARGHHLRRWTSPRDAYPEGRAGYLRWRAAAKQRHADELGALLRAEGYDDAAVERVASIVRKDGLVASKGAADPAVQVHEDALCLVFLQTQLLGVADQLGEPETVEVLVKTMRKMSPRGIAAAAELDLDDRGRELLRDAVAATEASAG
ncbi:DUF4202 domain-containing protein [Dermatobacter hominis]|uniref:DUF4202 domain-containing protein n=1 Tax=Dermatobacter hominis TaxID=2884263 RepID=UPI001D125716|nr:DUF4202 domain-containing protein [Dermatobacter hominis]UDY36783.1 DUF4202 domain-containing protein [Dermatobacter hominis]